MTVDSRTPYERDLEERIERLEDAVRTLGEELANIPRPVRRYDAPSPYDAGMPRMIRGRRP